VDSGIGATLRKARARREVELSEVEAATRINARFLRAIEEEDWDALPGDVYARGFVRAYADHLGLDGELLAAELGRQMRADAEPDAMAAATSTSSGHSRRSLARSPSAGRLAAVATVVAVAGVAVGIGLVAGGDDRVGIDGSRTGAVSPRGPAEPRPAPARPSLLSLELTATGEVWVCLLDAGAQPLVNGQILETGAEEGPFRSGSFTVSFGNGEVSMSIDGQEAEIPATSSPIGYAIDADGVLEPLAEGERPECL
jgi:cytoskeleton protein RodZ